MAIFGNTVLQFFKGLIYKVPLYSNMLIVTLAIDRWAVIFGTARRGYTGCSPTVSHPRCTKCNSPAINDQCTNFMLCGVAL